MLMIKLLRDVAAEKCRRRYCQDDLAAVLRRCRIMLLMALPSPAGDGATKSYDEDAESCWRRCCRVMLATTLLGQHGHDAMETPSMLGIMLPSHAGEGAAGATYPRREVDAESCW
jgi:hypothetical protein